MAKTQNKPEVVEPQFGGQPERNEAGVVQGDSACPECQGTGLKEDGRKLCQECEGSGEKK